MKPEISANNAMPENQMKDNQTERRTVIGEGSTIRLGLIMVLLSVFLGGIGASVWWAATISAKLDNIIAQQNASAASMNKVLLDVQDLQAWRKLIDNVGSPRLADLERAVSDLKKDLELHRATTLKSVP